MAFPNWSLFIQQAWAPGGSGGGCFPWPFSNGNVVAGTNPPYTVSDFLAFYPKFGGPPLNLTGAIIQGNPVVLLSAPPAGVVLGQLVVGLQIPSGTFIIDGPDSLFNITLSQAPLANGTNLIVYNQPFVPMFVLQLLVNLATSSLVFNRWQSQWPIGMALFIAHFATLYMQSDVSDSGTFNTPGQAAVAGLARGIATSKSAGGVSIGYTPVTPGIDDWAAWNLTSYGQQFATMAAAQGAGMMWIF